MASGSSVELVVDLGFQMTAIVKLKLLGVDTWELSEIDPAMRMVAIDAKNFTQDALRCDGDWPLLISTAKGEDGWLAKIRYPDPEDGGTKDLTTELIELGLGRAYS